MEAARDQKHIRGQKHLEEVEHKLKSFNLQYSTLGCWFVWINEPATKRLMFQALFFFFIISYRLTGCLISI